MQALTSYQHAHDAAGERASSRDDAIDREADAIIADKARLMEVIELRMADLLENLTDLAMNEYARNCTPKPDWVDEGRAQEIRKNIGNEIYEAVMKEARCVVDAREDSPHE